MTPIESASHDLFGDVADALLGLLPAELGAPRRRWHRYGIKVWFGPERPSREHYEAQVISARHVSEATVIALEVGFHAEHPKPADNEAVLGALVAEERRWRKALGKDAVAGGFLGRDSWARVSETWPDPDLGEDDLAVELATRLIDYITALEPVLRARVR
jgi:hypothetical protein